MPNMSCQATTQMYVLNGTEMVLADYEGEEALYEDEIYIQSFRNKLFYTLVDDEETQESK